MCILLANVAGPNHLLTGCKCTLHVHKPTVQLVASRNLFLDIQVVTLLLGKCSLFAHANLCYPTTRLHGMGCKRSFRYRKLHDVPLHLLKCYKNKANIENTCCRVTLVH